MRWRALAERGYKLAWELISEGDAMLASPTERELWTGVRDRLVNVEMACDDTPIAATRTATEDAWLGERMWKP